ncbi:hypothetical protein ACLOJK_019381 [Asimina triloba]
MAGKEDEESGDCDRENADCSFQWDEASQLYYHARSGFYHDPSAGWYYSSKDGLYYTFENGAYVLLESEKDEVPGASELTVSASKDTNEKPLDESCPQISGYQDDTVEELEEGEWIPDDEQEKPESSGREFNEDALWDEENWRAQYGQVVQTEEEDFPSFPIIDLWDWSMVSRTVGKKKRKVVRLIGRLVKRSAKLHPSMPAGGGLLRTAAICDVHLDLVRVVSGQVYKLRSPSTRYLTSLSTYDSSNPTKDWGFPDLLVNMCKASPKEIEMSHGSENPDEDSHPKPVEPFPVKEKQREHVYRDRAAERRILYGGFGIGPGQKISSSEDKDGGQPSCESFNTEVAAVEAMHMSFGAGSYARRILQGMGWKETPEKFPDEQDVENHAMAHGETLGNKNNPRGLKEPLQAVGNKGSAGLGWNTHKKL